MNADKELIILYETDNDKPARVRATRLYEPAIREAAISVHLKRILGELKNESIPQCQGNYIYQCDEDIFYHPRRLDSQFDAIHWTGLRLRDLFHELLFDTMTENVLCSHHWIWSDSLLCTISVAITQIKNPLYHRSEVSQFFTELYLRCGIGNLPRPVLYVYTYTLCNTWDYYHFRGRFEKRHTIPIRYFSD
ncbi:hypothetical protein [Spirosoma jeollabukense]